MKGVKIGQGPTLFYRGVHHRGVLRESTVLLKLV